MPLPSSLPGESHARPAPASAPCLSPAPTTTAGVVPDQAPSATLSTLADQTKHLSQQALAQQSSRDSKTSYSSSSGCSYSSDDARPAPGNTLTSAAPCAAPRAAPPAAPPNAPPAAPPLLPAGLGQDKRARADKPIGLDDAPAAPPAPSAADPTVSSSSWLEQQELAEVLDHHLTGVEAIEVSEAQ
jgi:hypothetical protein